MDPLGNTTSVRADVIELWDPIGLRYKTIQETIVGLPPATLSSIELLAGAIGNDPGYFNTVAEGLDSKASTAELASELTTRDTAIAAKSDLSFVNSELTTRDTAIAAKSDLSFVNSELTTRDTAIAAKSDLSFVNSEMTTRDTAIAEKSDLR
mgnify:CR=1 FL=1